MEIRIIKEGSLVSQRAIKSDFIPRKGDHILFEEYEEDEVECVVETVVFKVDAKDKVDRVYLYVTY